MKKSLILILFALLGYRATSQQVFFVYIQTEPAKPFYIKLGGKVYSSTAGGYLLLSKLVDSTYYFTLGFAGQQETETEYKINVAHRNYGYLLKDFAEKGWGLFDLQTMNVIFPEKKPETKNDQQAIPQAEVSQFTALLAKATGDPSLLEAPPTARQEVKTAIEPAHVVETVKQEFVVPDTFQLAKKESPVQMMDSVKTAPLTIINKEPVIEIKQVLAQPIDTIQHQSPVKPLVEEKTAAVISPVNAAVEEQKEKPKEEKTVMVPAEEKPVEIQVEQKLNRSVINRRSESSTTEGFGLVFIDKWEGGINDTIRLLIPNPKQLAGSVKLEPKTEKKFLDIQASAVKPADSPVVSIQEKSVPVNKEVKATIKDSIPVVTAQPVQAEKKELTECTEVAGEQDFFTLRKKMAAAEGDEDMISEARKYFKQKCFTVLQLKNLSALFLNDEARYNFFDAAYKYCADKPGFAALETELKDPYFINRFKAMLR